MEDLDLPVAGAQIVDLQGRIGSGQRVELLQRRATRQGARLPGNLVDRDDRIDAAMKAAGDRLAWYGSSHQCAPR
jgi:hypothetical protein